MLKYLGLLLLVCAAPILAYGQIGSGIVVVKSLSIAADSLRSSATDSVCPGENVTLTVAGGQLGTDAAWTWYTGACGNGAPIGTGASLAVNPATTLTYYCTAEGGCNTVLCRTITIAVLPPTACTPLPLDIVRFDAALYLEHRAMLTWATATETNLRQFILEQSADGSLFETLATLPATGDNSTYRHIDEQLYYGNNFYRLKMISSDGTFRYSATRRVHYSPDHIIAAALYPNPAASVLNFTFESGRTGTIQTWMYNIVSHKMYEVQSHKIEKGKNNIQWEVQHIPDGAYFFLYRVDGGAVNTIKFIKKT